MNIKWVGSPNYDTNRKPIDRVVIHWIVGTLASADAQFQKTNPGTSAHYGIENTTVHQYVKESDVAYHAGNYAMNQRSIGIEHSASPDRPASEATYQTSGKLLSEIAKRYNIPLDRQHVIGHKEVRATQCPGTIDIDKIIRIAKEQGSEGCLIPNTPEWRKTYEELVRKSSTWDEVEKLGYFSIAALKQALNKPPVTVPDTKSKEKLTRIRSILDE